MDQIYQIIEEEIIKKHVQAEVFISVFFILIDLFNYIIYLYIFQCKYKNDFPQKKNLSSFIFFDLILRIFKIFVHTFIYSLDKEIISTTLISIQFYFIIYSFNEIFNDQTNYESSDNNLKIKYPLLLTILFYLFAFDINFFKIVSFIKYIGAIICIKYFYNFLEKKINLFFSNIIQKSPKFKEYYINYLPFLISIYFSLFYLMRIINLLIENKLYYSYLEMISKIFVEVGKYLIFLLLFMIYFIFNKYLNNSIDNTKNITNIFREEEEPVKSKNSLNDDK